MLVTHVQDGAFREDLIRQYKPDVIVLEVIENGLRHMMSPLAEQ
jgi:hypothetical protein